MKNEFYGVLTKVFYSGNANKAGGEYKLTFMNIHTNEEIELYVKVKTKLQFDMSKQYVYRVIYVRGIIIGLYILCDSIQGYVNGEILDQSNNNIIEVVNPKIAFILHWTIVIIIFAFISYFLLSIFR